MLRDQGLRATYTVGVELVNALERFGGVIVDRLACQVDAGLIGCADPRASIQQPGLLKARPELRQNDVL